MDMVYEYDMIMTYGSQSYGRVAKSVRMSWVPPGLMRVSSVHCSVTASWDGMFWDGLTGLDSRRHVDPIEWMT